MCLLHSFYCWGAVAVILGSTLFFAVFGTERWQILALLWALVPLINVFQFLTCPIERLVEEDEGLSPRRLLRMPLLWMMILLMVCAGAAEASKAQWPPPSHESALGVSKTVGDLAGPCLFAVFMGLSRMLYGNPGTEGRSEPHHAAQRSALRGLLPAGRPLPLAGAEPGGMRGLRDQRGHPLPGAISLSSQACPKGGTAMFAFLALAGDFRRPVSPAVVGTLSEWAGGNLKTACWPPPSFRCCWWAAMFVLNRRQPAVRP